MLSTVLVSVVVFWTLTVYCDEDSNIECGQVVHESIEFESLNRIFKVYIPSWLCDEATTKSHADHSTSMLFTPQSSQSSQIPVPILLTLHPFRGSAEMMINRWKSKSEEYGFIIVAPEGTGDSKSWNAINCCGTGIERNVNDTGFIFTVFNSYVFNPSSSLGTFVNSYEHISVSEQKLIFMTGLSNGAFMADYLSWLSVTGAFPFTFVATNMFAGYIYHSQNLLANYTAMSPKKTLPTFMHLAQKDETVRIDGCCSNTTTDCGPVVNPYPDVCVSAYDEFNNWVNWSQENKEHSVTSMHVYNSKKGKQVNCTSIKCNYGTCQSINQFCVYDEAVHASFTADFAMGEDETSILFFREALCMKFGATWDEQTHSCIFAVANEETPSQNATAVANVTSTAAPSNETGNQTSRAPTATPSIENNGTTLPTKADSTNATASPTVATAANISQKIAVNDTNTPTQVIKPTEDEAVTTPPVPTAEPVQQSAPPVPTAEPVAESGAVTPPVPTTEPVTQSSPPVPTAEPVASPTPRTLFDPTSTTGTGTQNKKSESGAAPNQQKTYYYSKSRSGVTDMLTVLVALGVLATCALMANRQSCPSFCDRMNRPPYAFSRVPSQEDREESIALNDYPYSDAKDN